MTSDDREWLEQHIKGPLLQRFDRIETQIGDLRERVAKVEVRAEQRAGLVAAVVSIIAALVTFLLRGVQT